MDDATEQQFGRVHALGMLQELKFPLKSFGEGMVTYAIELLTQRFESERISRIYTASLTTEEDSLEQWRAYCPRSGGVALGFPTEDLKTVATLQESLLAPCVIPVGNSGRLCSRL